MNITSKFAGTCKACGGRFYQGTIINWTREFGAKHLTENECNAHTALDLPEPEDTKLDASGIVTFLTAAKDRGLKWPKANFLAPNDRTLRLSISGSDSHVPGSVQVKLSPGPKTIDTLNYEWLGRIEPDGKIVGRKLSEDGAVLDLLKLIETEPAEQAKRYGSVTGQCSFCAKTLTDEGSIEVGYGPVCAARYELPHKPRGSKATKPVAPAILEVA